MRVGLFDDETMEPLTVLTLPIWAHEILRADEPVTFPIWTEMHGDFRMIDVPKVTLWFEQFVRHGECHWFCSTRDSENALKLRSVFLPGQQKEVQRRERDAFLKGLAVMLRDLI